MRVSLAIKRIGQAPRSCAPALDATDRLLRAFFRRSVHHVTLGALLGAAGCLPEDANPGQELDAVFTPFACLSEGGIDWHFSEVQTDVPVDYLALKMASFTGVHLDAEHGLLCEGANDPDACKAQAAALEQGLRADREPCGAERCDYRNYLLTSSDTGAQVWQTEAEVRQLLGSIETPSEANLLLRVTADEYPYSCDNAESHGYRVTPEGIEIRILITSNMCRPHETSHVTRLVRPDGSVEEIARKVYETEPEACVVAGRRPEGLRSGACPSVEARPRARERRVDEQEALAHYFGAAAHLEAASVSAFEILADELIALGAPRALVEKALQAREDEVAHAISVGAIASRFGAQPTPVEIEPRALRSAFALALDNAVEGCVRETFGALLGTFQAVHAEDRQIRDAMQTIAEDETRHAGLAWQIATWLMPRLSEAERTQLRTAQREAVAALRHELSSAQPEGLQTLAGLPTPEQAGELLQHLERSLWQDAFAHAA